ncbi:unnamed protein product [Mytilus coruscus]|uniref:Uncharacterized protein n=1 Tax=Mytilus coruscus TaxID=42192 RepID=A0A6J8EZC2_MYTCO|nr:unnamed protein product [Mytilus coruscus]
MLYDAKANDCQSHDDFKFNHSYKNVPEKVENPVLRKICNSTEEKIRQKKRELFDDEQKLTELETSICEPVALPVCLERLSCGQKDKHKEYRDDKKKLHNRIKNIKTEVADLEGELVRASAYEAKSGNSFTQFVKDRLRKINPRKYSQSSVLLRYIMTLTVSQNDKLELPKTFKEVNTKIKKEYDSDSSNTDSPPCKTMCTVTS